MEDNTIISLIGQPNIIGNIKTIGHWNGSSDILDPYYDILQAIDLIPDNEKPDHILVGNKARNCLHMLDSEHKPFISYLPILFGYYILECDQGDEFSELLRKSFNNMVYNKIVRVSYEVPNDIVLLVSNKNSIVIINIM
jgi:hypothetical protein